MPFLSVQDNSKYANFEGTKEDANSPLFCCCKSNHENQNNHIGNSKKIKELETKVNELSNKSRNVESSKFGHYKED